MWWPVSRQPTKVARDGGRWSEVVTGVGAVTRVVINNHMWLKNEKQKTKCYLVWISFYFLFSFLEKNNFVWLKASATYFPRIVFRKEPIFWVTFKNISLNSWKSFLLKKWINYENNKCLFSKPVFKNCCGENNFRNTKRTPTKTLPSLPAKSQ